MVKCYSNAFCVGQNPSPTSPPNPTPTSPPNPTSTPAPTAVPPDCNSCNIIKAPDINGAPVTLDNGVVVTATCNPGFEDCTSGVFNTDWTSCDITVPANSLYMNYGQYSMSFSAPITKLGIVLARTGVGGNTGFILVGNGSPGVFNISSSCNCYYDNDGGNTNFIRSGEGSTITGPKSGGGGGVFLLEMPEGFTKLTIYGEGSLNSILCLCSNVFTNPPPCTIENCNNGFPCNIGDGPCCGDFAGNCACCPEPTWVCCPGTNFCAAGLNDCP